MNIPMELRDILTQLMNRLPKIFEGGNLSVHIDLMPALGIAAYVLLGLGLFALAKNRRIQNPWLAWIPVGNLWLLGCISDQYQYVVNGQVTNKRKALLVLNIVRDHSPRTARNFHYQY